MENMSIQTAQHREIGVVTAEIKELKRQAQATALVYVIEIGRRLKEVKGFIPHGEWSGWLQNEVEFSQSTAINFMKIYEEYGSDQLTIFGAVTNSQSIANLPYTKALKLLAIPSEERETFAEKVDAENISVKELDEAIKQRKEAEKRAEELEKKLAEVESAREREEAAECERNEAAAKIASLEKSLEEEKKKLSAESEKLKKALENPQIPEGEIKKIKEEAAKKASEATEIRLHEEIAAAKERLEKAENEARIAKSFAAKAESELDAMEKRLKTASPEVTAFKTLFDVTQTNAKKLKEMLNTIRASDPDLGDKLANAMEALADILKG